MKTCRWMSLLAVLCLAGCAVPQATSQPDATQAIARGEARKFLSEMKTKAAEAERNRDLALAARTYNLAARVALDSGQLQKGLSYSSKGWELAEKTRVSWQQVAVTYYLVRAYSSLKQYEKSTEWIEKGIDIANRLPVDGTREDWEGLLYRSLGADSLRLGDHQKAIESLTYSVQILDSRLSYWSRRPSYLPQLHNAVHIVVLSLSDLARAYERVGNVEEAIRAYQKGIDLIRQFQAKTTAEGFLYLGLGRLYLSQKDFPRALDNLHKALARAECQQVLPAMGRASIGIGDALNQSGKPAEAVSYYQTAIEQTESTRALLQSQDFRQSFFEGELATYVRMIGVLSDSGKAGDAFRYAERARSRAFLDLLGNKAQLSKTKSGLIEEERALQERIGKAYGENLARHKKPTTPFLQE